MTGKLRPYELKYMYSFVCQAVIFRVVKHPIKDFYQCATVNFFREIADVVKVGKLDKIGQQAVSDKGRLQKLRVLVGTHKVEHD